ncbi:MAG: helix-turn-helix domain-containing protein [Candidatus Competibacterales bacterium]
MPYADIAAHCGFSSQSHLARHFQRLFRVTPKAYTRGVPRPGDEN